MGITPIGGMAREKAAVAEHRANYGGVFGLECRFGRQQDSGMNMWEEAILKTYHLAGGCAANQEIYDNVGKFVSLTTQHFRPTAYGGRPAYVHQVRSHITNLVQNGDLTRMSRERYCLTLKGKNRIK